MGKYILYVDDSGTKEYLPLGEAYHDGNTPHFTFAGTLVSDRMASMLPVQIRLLKRRVFGVADVEVKSYWLRNQRERARRYLDRFKIAPEALDRFVEELYTLIVKSDLRLLAIVVDKRAMQEDYPNPWNPHAVAYDMLLQRVQFEMDKGDSVRIIIDDMTGATPKHNQFKKLMRAQHDKFMRFGSDLQRELRFAAVEDLRFLPSSASDLIQVSDLVAYASRRQFIDHGPAWEDASLDQLPMYPWFARLAPKFCCSGAGEIQGYGLVKFPRKDSLRWRADGTRQK